MSRAVILPGSPVGIPKAFAKGDCSDDACTLDASVTPAAGAGSFDQREIDPDQMAWNGVTTSFDGLGPR